LLSCCGIACRNARNATGWATSLRRRCDTDGVVMPLLPVGVITPLNILGSTLPLGPLDEVGALVLEGTMMSGDGMLRSTLRLLLLLLRTLTALGDVAELSGCSVLPTTEPTDARRRRGVVEEAEVEVDINEGVTVFPPWFVFSLATERRGMQLKRCDLRRRVFVC
jgi:hypothetical protein